MTYKEREILISLASLFVVGIPYIASVFLRFNNSDFSADEELKFWAISILLMIPLRIVSMIIMYILFAISKAIITGKEDDMKEIVDERDKLIDLKGSQNAHWVFLSGFGIGLVLLALGQGIATFFVVTILFGALSEITESLTKICYYRGRITS